MNRQDKTKIEVKSHIPHTEESEKTSDMKKGPSAALFTVQEVAKYWRSAPGLVYDAIRLGKLRAFKNGNSWRIPLEALEDYEAEQSKACRYCQQTEFQQKLNEIKSKCIMKIH